MRIIVWATDAQWKELTDNRAGAAWQRAEDYESFIKYDDADAFFCLQQNFVVSDFKETDKPVFINSVKNTLTALNAPENVLRINGWSTFLNRQAWEVAGKIDEQVLTVFNSLNIKINSIADEPGFISARIISMIINEAYFALGDEISSKAEIDTAMKLGTNYPYGPFEWAELIGEENILSLLQKLSEADTRYQPAALLLAEVKKKNK